MKRFKFMFSKVSFLDFLYVSLFFSTVLPPRGRRHVLVQLDRSDDDNNAARTLSFYGNIYPFKDRFEDVGVPGALTVINPSQHNDYVRFLELKLDDACKQKVQEVLEDVLKGLPLYFINMAGSADPMASWLLQQPSIVEAEGPWRHERMSPLAETDRVYSTIGSVKP